MSIPITLEPEDTPFRHIKERCCLCRTPTNYWHASKDVAVCEACAETGTVEQLPSKAEWIANERALAPLSHITLRVPK